MAFDRLTRLHLDLMNLVSTNDMRKKHRARARWAATSQAPKDSIALTADEFPPPFKAVDLHHSRWRQRFFTDNARLCRTLHEQGLLSDHEESVIQEIGLLGSDTPVNGYQPTEARLHHDPDVHDRLLREIRHYIAEPDVADAIHSPSTQRERRHATIALPTNEVPYWRFSIPAHWYDKSNRPDIHRARQQVRYTHIEKMQIPPSMRGSGSEMIAKASRLYRRMSKQSPLFVPAADTQYLFVHNVENSAAGPIGSFDYWFDNLQDMVLFVLRDINKNREFGPNVLVVDNTDSHYYGNSAENREGNAIAARFDVLRGLTTIEKIGSLGVYKDQIETTFHVWPHYLHSGQEGRNWERGPEWRERFYSYVADVDPNVIVFTKNVLPTKNGMLDTRDVLAIQQDSRLQHIPIVRHYHPQPKMRQVRVGTRKQAENPTATQFQEGKPKHNPREGLADYQCPTKISSLDGIYYIRGVTPDVHMIPGLLNHLV